MRITLTVPAKTIKYHNALICPAPEPIKSGFSICLLHPELRYGTCTTSADLSSHQSVLVCTLKPLVGSIRLTPRAYNNINLHNPRPVSIRSPQPLISRERHIHVKSAAGASVEVGLAQRLVAAEVVPPLCSYFVDNAAVCTLLDSSFSLLHPELRYGPTSTATSLF